MTEKMEKAEILKIIPRMYQDLERRYKRHNHNCRRREAMESASMFWGTRWHEYLARCDREGEEAAWKRLKDSWDSMGEECWNYQWRYINCRCPDWLTKGEPK